MPKYIIRKNSDYSINETEDFINFTNLSCSIPYFMPLGVYKGRYYGLRYLYGNYILYIYNGDQTLTSDYYELGDVGSSSKVLEINNLLIVVGDTTNFYYDGLSKKNIILPDASVYCYSCFYRKRYYYFFAGKKLFKTSNIDDVNSYETIELNTIGDIHHADYYGDYGYLMDSSHYVYKLDLTNDTIEQLGKINGPNYTDDVTVNKYGFFLEAINRIYKNSISSYKSFNSANLKTTNQATCGVKAGKNDIINNKIFYSNISGSSGSNTLIYNPETETGQVITDYSLAFLRTKQLNLTFNDYGIKYTIHGVKDEKTDNLYLIDVNDNFLIEIFTKEGYTMSNIETTGNIISQSDNHLIIEYSGYYNEDNLILNTIYNPSIDKGKYYLNKTITTEKQNIIKEVNLLGSYGNRYLNISNITINGDNVIFNGKYDDNADFSLSLDEIDNNIVVNEKFSSGNDFIYNLFVPAVDEFFTKVSIKLNKDEFVTKYELTNKYKLMEDGTYIFYTYNNFTLPKINVYFDDFHMPDNVTANYSATILNYISYSNISFGTMEDNANIIINATSKLRDVITEVNLYRNNYRQEKINKFPSLVRKVNCRFRDIKSITNPIIYLETAEIDFNYVSFELLGVERYYYVQDYNSLGNNLYSLNLQEDYLKTWSNNLQYLSGLAERYSGSEKILDDNLMSTNLTPIFSTKTITNSTGTMPLNVNGCFVVNLLGKTLGLQEEEFTLSTIINPSLRLDVFTNPYGQALEINPKSIIIRNYSTVVRLYNWLVENNLQSYFISCYYYPLDLINKENGMFTSLYKVTNININVGEEIKNFTFEDSYGEVYTNYLTTTRYITCFDFDFDKELNNIYEKRLFHKNRYDMYIPYVGVINLDTIKLSEIENPHFVMSYDCDLLNGTASYYLTETTTNYIFSKGDCQLSSAIVLASDNDVQITNKKNALNNNLALSLIGSSIGLTASAATGNVVAFTGSLLSSVNSVNNYVNSIKTLYPQANIGSISSGNFGSRELSNIIIFEHKFKPMIKNFDIYNYLFGQPYNDIIYYDDIKDGEYVKFTKIYFTQINDMLKTEYDNLISLLINGVIK